MMMMMMMKTLILVQMLVMVVVLLVVVVAADDDKPTHGADFFTFPSGSGWYCRFQNDRMVITLWYDWMNI